MPLYTQSLQRDLTLKRNVSEPLTIPNFLKHEELGIAQTDISPTDPSAKSVASYDPLSESQ